MAELAKSFYICTALFLWMPFGSQVWANEVTQSSTNVQYFLYQSAEYPRDCQEAFNQCSSTNVKSGVYLIKPDQYPEPFEVYCENNLTTGGWMVIERRQNGSISFTRSWDDYKYGFGFLGSEFWIGNERLAHVTNQRRYKLRIDLENTEGQSYFLTYDNFRIADEWDNYSLSSLGANDQFIDVNITWCMTNKYNESASICERTCESPNECIPKNSSEPERCICQGNFLFQEGSCIPKERCGCYDRDNDIVVGEGESYLKFNCSLRMTCRNNRLISVSSECGDDATCEETDGVGICTCNEWYEGDGFTCTRVGPRDCYDLYKANRTVDGTYSIHPEGSSGFEAYCDMSNGGWTILQKRSSGSLTFYRDWNEYRNGFGNSEGDHWLGNDKIHNVTNQRTYQLRIETTSSEGSSYYSSYSSFRISDESQKYELTLGSYDGNADNNAMGASSGYRFSTHTEDNDGSSTYDCAEKHRGGWWYPDAISTGTTENCYSFSNRAATGRYEYSDCGCYAYCGSPHSCSCGVGGCYCYSSCGGTECCGCLVGRSGFKCTDCDGCSGSRNYRCCRNKNAVYETNFYSCGYSNLNGDYQYNDYRGIFWQNLPGSDCSITATIMKILPTEQEM